MDGFGSRLHRLMAIGFVLGGLIGCSRDSYDGPHRHVILLSIDTLRADHSSGFGSRAGTPAIDALASQAIRFVDVTTAAPTTLAAHTSLFTGSYPRTHGVPRNGFSVHDANQMLPELLKSAGFTTAAFLGSYALDRMFGFGAGFDHYDQDFDQLIDMDAFDQNQRTADRVTDAVLEWSGRRNAGSERLFLFAHYFDVHATYRPPPPYDAMYGRADGPRTSSFDDLQMLVQRHHDAIVDDGPGLMGAMRHGLSNELLDGANGEPTALDRDLAALYAGEVSYVDSQVGRLLEGLQDQGILDDAIVVITADHGESFWVHGDFWNHGLAVYQSTVHVPLLLRLPPANSVAVQIDTPVSSVDVLPTLCELLGIPTPERVDGRSLVSSWNGSELEVVPVFSESTQPVGASFERDQVWRNQMKARCVRWGPWKYIHTPYLQRQELYNLETDPHERTNLLPADDAATRSQAEVLREVLAAWARDPQPLPSRFNPAQSQDAMERLRSLGYVGGR